MKKFTFFMLALFLCSVSMFAIDAKDVKVGINCGGATHSFTSPMTITLEHDLASVIVNPDDWPTTITSDNQPEGFTARGVTLYYTTDGTDPKNGQKYYDNTGSNEKKSLTGITIEKTAIIRTAVLVTEQPYTYELQSGTKYKRIKGTKTETWYTDEEYQPSAAFVNFKKVPVMDIKGGILLGDTYKYYSGACTLNFKVPEGGLADVIGKLDNLDTYFPDGLKVIYTVNGKNPTEWDGNPITIDFNGKVEAYYSVGQPACSYATHTAKQIAISEKVPMTFEKTDRPSVQTAICDNAPGSDIYTKGFCVGKVGDYAFFSDGTATFTINSPAEATVGQYYLVDGQLLRESNKLAGLSGVDGTKAKTKITAVDGVTGQTPAATTIDPAYLEDWMEATTAGAVVNASMVATYEGGVLKCGDIEVTPYDASVLADAYETALVVKGTLYGRKGGKALFDVESYTQATPKEILALANPKIRRVVADSPYSERVDAKHINFIDDVTVNIKSDESTAVILYTLDGTNPTYTYSDDVVTPTGTTKVFAGKFKLKETATVKAIAVVNGETSGDISVRTFTKLSVTSIDYAVYNTSYEALALVGGTAVDYTEINGTPYTIIKDATGTMLIQAKLEYGMYYHVGGKFINNSSNLFMPGFLAENLYIKSANDSYNVETDYKEMGLMPYFTWLFSGNTEPKYAVSLKVDLDVASKSAYVEGFTSLPELTIVDDYGILDDAHDGEAIIYGSLVGKNLLDDTAVYFLIHRIKQSPANIDETIPEVYTSGSTEAVSGTSTKYVEQITVELEAEADDTRILYTTDGTNPSYTVEENELTGERNITLTGTTKEYDPAEPLVFNTTTVLKSIGVLDGYDLGYIKCDTLIRMVPETVQTLVTDYSAALKDGQKPLVLTKGFVTYKSPAYLVITDGTANIKVNMVGYDYDAYFEGTNTEITEDIKAGDYVLIAGNLKEDVGGLIGIKKNYIAKVLTEDKLPVTEPTTITADNLAKWVENYNSEPIVNVVIPAEYVSDKKATVGDVTLELRGFDADTIPAPYAGPAMVYGTIIGRDIDSKTVFVRTTRVDQAPEKLETATPIFTIGKEGEFFENFDGETPALTKFIDTVTANIKSEYDIPDWKVQLIYTLDGTTPTFEVDEEGNIVPTYTTQLYDGKDLDLTIDKTCTLKAITLVGTYPTDMVVRDFIKLEPVSGQTFVFDTDPGALALTKGLVLKNIEYEGNTYSVVSDGTGSYILRNAGVEENVYYFLGGFANWNDEKLNYIIGLNQDEKPGVYVSDWTEDGQFSMRATYVSPENLAVWVEAYDKQPLYNVALKASELVAPAAGATSTTATCTSADGSTTTLKLIGKLEGYDPTIFTGEAIIEGIVFGYDGTDALVYVTDIIQKPAVIIGEPDINIPFEYAVDASEPVELTYTFLAEDMILNDASIDPTSVKGDVTWSLRTRDGRVIKTDTQTEVTLTDENTIELAEEDVNTGSEYIVTIDNVIVYAHDPLEIVNVQDDFTMSKKFTTEECYVTDAVMSYFPEFTISDPDAMEGEFGNSEFTITVQGANAVEINEAAIRKIKIYNTVDNSITYAPKAVTASGNQITFDVTGLCDDDPYTQGLRMGMYKVLLPAEAIKVDGFYNPERITFNLTVGIDEDKERLEMMMDIDKYLNDLAIVPMGVNIFQFTPRTCEKFLQAVKNAWYEAYTIQNNFDEKERLEKANKVLDEAYEAFLPTYPAGNQTYIISISEEGHASKKYLNIDGDVPVISETPSYIQFHAVQTITDYQLDEPYCWKTRTWYLYNTPTRRYLGYAEKNDEKELYLTNYPNNKLDDFYVVATHFNDWYIGKIWGGETAYDYVYFSDLCAMNSKVYLDESKVISEDYEKYVKDNKKEPSRSYEWYIEEADDPNAAPAPSTEEGDDSAADDATAITSAQAASMDAEFYSTSGARLRSPKKGVNIVKFSNGQVKKYFVK